MYWNWPNSIQQLLFSFLGSVLIVGCICHSGWNSLLSDQTMLYSLVWRDNCVHWHDWLPQQAAPEYLLSHSTAKSIHWTRRYKRSKNKNPFEIILPSSPYLPLDFGGKNLKFIITKTRIVEQKLAILLNLMQTSTNPNLWNRLRLALLPQPIFASYFLIPKWFAPASKRKSNCRQKNLNKVH